MDTLQTASHHDDRRRRAISELIDSVADEQKALARILEAEHKKIEKAAELCRSDVDDLVKIDRSVEQVLAAVTRLEQAAQRAESALELLRSGQAAQQALSSALYWETAWSAL